jgi:hypothetical protein
MILGSSLEGAYRLTQSPHQTTELLDIAYQYGLFLYTDILSLDVFNYHDFRQLARHDF